MTRHRDWQSRLQDCIAERWAKPFAWGVQDCCLFVCDCIQAMTGRDPAADVRGYTTEKQAQRIVKRLGGIRAIGASRFGKEIPPLMAQAGDVGMVETSGRLSLAICGGSHWVAPAGPGLSSLPFDAALAAWRAA